MTCRRCQHQLPGFARFCSRCGTAVGRPNRVARLTAALLLFGAIGFFLLIGLRSNSYRRVNHQQMYPPTNFQPTHQSWPTMSPRNGSIQVYTSERALQGVDQEVERSFREIERRRGSSR
jgi:hypothetical protein